MRAENQHLMGESCFFKPERHSLSAACMTQGHRNGWAFFGQGNHDSPRLCAASGGLALVENGSGEQNVLMVDYPRAARPLNRLRDLPLVLPAHPF